MGDYEEEITGTHVRKIHYLSGAILIQNNGVDSLLYTYTDNQGSLIALTNESGAVVEKYAYDPWGARRNPTDWKLGDMRTSWITNRGYTGHEHLSPFGGVGGGCIINMNGRVYDPLTAQFLSPDPFIQSPDNWTNYNRYGYCMGNPMINTDPSGYLQVPYDIGNGLDEYGKWATGVDAMYNYQPGAGGGGGHKDRWAWDADHNGQITYNWETKRYEYENGKEATQDAAMEQANPSDIESYTTFGFDHLFTTNWHGTTILAGSIGGIITGYDGSYFKKSSSNTIAYQLNPVLWGLVYFGNNTKNNNVGDIFTGAGFISSDIGLIKGASEFGIAGEFKSATSWGGWNQLLPNQQAWRSIRVLGKPFAKGLSILGHVGTFLGGASAIYSGYKVYNEIDAGGLENVKVLDATDTLFGAAGTVSSIALAVGASNPIGWAALGAVATGYGVYRLGVFISTGE